MDNNRYDPLESTQGNDEFSKEVAQFHNFLRANHECLHVILGLGASEIEEIMLHAMMIELMPAPLSAHLIAYLATAGYSARGFTSIRESDTPLEAFRKNGIKARLTVEALTLSREIGKELKLSGSNLMTANLTSDKVLNASIFKLRQEFRITLDMTHRISAFLKRVAQFKKS